MENIFFIKTEKDENNRLWLVSISGISSTYTIPANIYGIRKTAFFGCDGLKELHIPSNVKIIEENTFSSYDHSLTIYAEEKSRPEGWYYTETCIDSYTEDYEHYYEMQVHSFLGSYCYTCDFDDKIVSCTIAKPVVYFK